MDYQTIKKTRTCMGLLGTICAEFGITVEYSIRKSNRIIEDVVQQIIKYEANRGIKVEYRKFMVPKGEEIQSVFLESNDGIVAGTIDRYTPRGYDNPRNKQGSITAKIHFNSEDLSLQEEYLGLAKIVSKM